MSSITSWLLLGQCLFSPVFSAASKIPAQAQAIDQRIFNVLNITLPPAEFNATSVGDPQVCVAALHHS